MLIKHKEDCLSINGVQPVNVEEGITEFENYFNDYQLHLKFMLFLNVIQEMLKFMKVLTQKNIMIVFLVVLLITLFLLTINLVNRLLFIEAKMLLMNLLKQFLKNISTAKK